MTLSVRDEGFKNAVCAHIDVLLHRQYVEETHINYTTIGFSSNKILLFYDLYKSLEYLWGFLVFNAIFNNISVIFYGDKTTENLWK